METPINNNPSIHSENCTPTYGTPPPHHGSQDSAKVGTHKLTPDPLKVPEALKYEERYKSPTDFMMSPVSKGLLARGRKMGAHLPPAEYPLKIQNPCFQDARLPQI